VRRGRPSQNEKAALGPSGPWLGTIPRYAEAVVRRRTCRTRSQAGMPHRPAAPCACSAGVLLARCFEGVTKGLRRGFEGVSKEFGRIALFIPTANTLVTPSNTDAPQALQVAPFSFLCTPGCPGGQLCRGGLRLNSPDRTRRHGGADRQEPKSRPGCPGRLDESCVCASLPRRLQRYFFFAFFAPLAAASASSSRAA
jgi:hypothetical protein